MSEQPRPGRLFYALCPPEEVPVLSVVTSVSRTFVKFRIDVDEQGMGGENRITHRTLFAGMVQRWCPDPLPAPTENQLDALRTIRDTGSVDGVHRAVLRNLVNKGLMEHHVTDAGHAALAETELNQ